MFTNAASKWSDFRGVIPILAMPASILMPYAIQPLQLKSSTDHELAEQIRTGNRLLGLAILKPGWERLKDTTTAAIFEYGCLAEVTVQHSAVSERTVVLARGLCRMQVNSETTTGPVRSANVVAVPDRYPSPAAIDRTRRRDELLDAFQAIHPLESLELFESLLRHELSLGCLSDVLTQSLPLPPATSAELLGTSNVDLRSDLLLDHMRRSVRSSSEKSPTYSCN